MVRPISPGGGRNCASVRLVCASGGFAHAQVADCECQPLPAGAPRTIRKFDEWKFGLLLQSVGCIADASAAARWCRSVPQQESCCISCLASPPSCLPKRRRCLLGSGRLCPVPSGLREESSSYTVVLARPDRSWHLRIAGVITRPNSAGPGKRPTGGYPRRGEARAVPDPAETLAVVMVVVVVVILVIPRAVQSSVVASVRNGHG
jgi:hypothetical protein